MIVFVIFLIILGLFTTLFAISLADKRWKEAVLLLSISVLPIIAYPIVSQWDINLLRGVIANVSLLNTLTFLMIVEGLIGMWMGMSAIKSHYHSDVKRKKYVNLFYMPSLSVVGAVVFATYFAMMRVSGIDHFIISLGVAGAVFITLFLMLVLIKLIIKSWSKRLELRMILTIASVVCASYIPIFLRDNTFKGVYEPQELHTILLFGSISIFMIVQGILFNVIITKYKGRKSSNGNS